MVVHLKDPQYVSHHVNVLCKVCAREKRACWKRAYYNVEGGRMFCEWEAPDQESLEGILVEKGVYCEEIVEVKLQTPEECAWEIFGEFHD